MIDSYTDIHRNLRFWIPRILDGLRRVRGCVVYYDVGANEGVLSLPYLSAVDAVVAFEPGPAAERFTSAIPREGREKVTVHRVALGDREGECRLNLYSDDTFSSLYPRPGSDLETYALTLEEERTVPLTTLDALRGSAGFPPPDFVKIDIEGAELPALRGMIDTVQEGRPAFLIEYSCINTGNAGYDRREIVDILESWGYTPRGLFRADDTTLHRDLEPCAIWNLVAFPEDLAAETLGENR